ncbi:hypothetical protein HPP92_004948 [Vanilla planifolia]|uniref:A-kinase anchor protein 7-like phosphoesterase domain-containing protein n=1 Tax=Vanilla planifolia TaxID=51239 RepID=A0A835RLV6_VANPL|nr:hypothetical protein HPP92_004948 [Vanilla planifolia]
MEKMKGKGKGKEIAGPSGTVIDQAAVKSPNLDYSHFISLPLAMHSELVEKLHGFQNSILVKREVQSSNEHFRVNMDADRTNISKSSTLSVLGIDRSIFINPRTFHLTVLMLRLWNKDRVALATEVLKGVSSKVMDALENRPVSVRLRGLDLMRGSPAKAHVLYVPVEEVGGEGRLLRACQVIIDAYVESGLVLEKDAGHSLKQGGN